MHAAYHSQRIHSNLGLQRRQLFRRKEPPHFSGIAVQKFAYIPDDTAPADAPGSHCADRG